MIKNNFEIPRRPESFRTLTASRCSDEMDKFWLVYKDRDMSFSDLDKWYKEEYTCEMFGRKLPNTLELLIKSWWNSNLISRFQTMKQRNIDIDVNAEISRFIITLFGGNYEDYLRCNVNYLVETINYWLCSWGAPILDDVKYLPLRDKWLKQMKEYEESDKVVIPYPDFYPFILPSENGAKIFIDNPDIAFEYAQKTAEVVSKFEHMYKLQPYEDMLKERASWYAKSAKHGRYFDEFIMKVPPIANIEDFGDAEEKSRRLKELKID